MRDKRSRYAGAASHPRSIEICDPIVYKAGSSDLGDSATPKTVRSQVTKLKRAAEARFDSILKSIRQNGTSPSPASSMSTGPADLQARLEAAIGVLQDGLIERDTEVKPCIATHSIHAADC